MTIRTSHGPFAAGMGTIVLCLTLASVAAPQEGASTVPVRDIHRLGGSTALYKTPLTTAASLQRMAGVASVVVNIGDVLGQAGLSDLADDVVATLVAASTSVRGGTCSDAAPAEGTIVECDVQPGQTLQWMAYRPEGGARLGLLRDIRWAGLKPFQAYLFRITENNRIYTFVVPKECGNLSLMRSEDTPRMALVAPPPELPPALSALIAPPVPEPPPALSAPALPPPPMEVSSAQAQPAAAIGALPFFIDALIGKDRRVRPIEGSGLEFAQCSPLLGLKVGVAKRFQNDWELAGALGIAVSLVTTDGKVNEHALFADIEANKYLSGGAFLGTGLSLWDLTRTDTFTPAWMVHVGVPLAADVKFPVYFLAEGRLFFDHLDEVRNNYQFWGGVRVRF